MSGTTTPSIFDGLAFPVATVRYKGDTSHFNATIVRDRDRTYRARVPYSHEIGPGARNAVRAALAAFEKMAEDNPSILSDGPHYPVPGDMNSDAYVFTFVPARFFA
jgi:hypothetical protein